jgi:glycine betaine/choline ABC-type transport system substrate-binding protein
MILVAGALLALAGCRGEAPRPIVVGSKNFTEQVILAELLAQQVEARAGLPVERRVNLGGTWICHRAITAGEIDVYVEYTGTALTAILKEPPVADPGAAYSRVKEEYARRFDLEWLSPLGFDNTFAMVVRGADARKHRLRSISDVARVASRWRPGFGYEFLERPDGYRGLVETYGLRFGRPPRIMDLGLIYRALKEGRVDIVAGNSTDGAIAALDLVALEDDRRYFPPYEAAAVARAGTLDRHPSVREALESLAGILSAEDMRRLNDAVDGRGRHARAVAEEFRRERGL